MKDFIAIVLLLNIYCPAFAADYVIGDGDVLQVSVWGVPELSVQVKVRPDGKITLPASGDVVATGKTPKMLGRQIRGLLGKFVKEPVVTLTVVEVTNNKVYVAGGGVPSRVVNLDGRTTLFRFLCQIENLENADLSESYLLRNGKRVVADFYALLNKGDMSKDLNLEPEDILYIPDIESKKIYVVGAVKEPKFIQYRENIKVLEAILIAGGFDEYAKENDVSIVRKNKKKIRVKITDLVNGKDLDQNVSLLPGDYVVISEGFF
jgi:polysaccharide export outer membrane protein